MEVGGSWRAARARWQARVPSRTETLGHVDTEELQEQTGLPDSPRPGRTYRNVSRRWRFSAWLRE
jgi:hypothetical protein